MKKYFLLLIILISTLKLSAQNEVGPDGGKLIWLLLILIVLIVVLVVLSKRRNKKKPFFTREKIRIQLEKDRLYFPDNIKLQLKNSGNIDIDLDRPLLIFDSFWLKRKFKLKGIESRILYPLYLDKGSTHSLNIDLNHFYSYDKKLKKYSKITIKIFNVKGKNLGSNSVYIRKTLIKY